MLFMTIESSYKSNLKIAMAKDKVKIADSGKLPIVALTHYIQALYDVNNSMAQLDKAMGVVK